MRDPFDDFLVHQTAAPVAVPVSAAPGVFDRMAADLLFTASSPPVAHARRPRGATIEVTGGGAAGGAPPADRAPSPSLLTMEAFGSPFSEGWR